MSDRVRTEPSEIASLAERIRNDMLSFTPSEKRAAHLLLSHYPFAGLDTVAEFAGRAGVSAPSVLRFVTRLGFSGFPDFQRHLREELEAQLLSPLGKAQPREVDPTAPALASFAEAVAGNLRATVDNIAPAEFEAVIELLSEKRRHLHFTGGRFTGAIALYAESHFRIVRGHVSYIDPQPARWRDRMIEIGRKDVIVAFDIRRYQEDVIALCETAARQGATVVLLTDPWLSPIARVASHVLPAHVTAPSNWDSSAGLPPPDRSAHRRGDQTSLADGEAPHGSGRTITDETLNPILGRIIPLEPCHHEGHGQSDSNEADEVVNAHIKRIQAEDQRQHGHGLDTAWCEGHEAVGESDAGNPSCEVGKQGRNSHADGEGRQAGEQRRSNGRRIDVAESLRDEDADQHKAACREHGRNYAGADFRRMSNNAYQGRPEQHRRRHLNPAQRVPTASPPSRMMAIDRARPPGDPARSAHRPASRCRT